MAISLSNLEYADEAVRTPAVPSTAQYILRAVRAAAKHGYSLAGVPLGNRSQQGGPSGSTDQGPGSTQQQVEGSTQQVAGGTVGSGTGGDGGSAAAAAGCVDGVNGDPAAVSGPKAMDLDKQEQQLQQGAPSTTKASTDAPAEDGSTKDGSKEAGSTKDGSTEGNVLPHPSGELGCVLLVLYARRVAFCCQLLAKLGEYVEALGPLLQVRAPVTLCFNDTVCYDIKQDSNCALQSTIRGVCTGPGAPAAGDGRFYFNLILAL